MGYLTKDELAQFDEYKHVTPKTTFELWMINRAMPRIERLIPDVSSTSDHDCSV